MTPITGLDVTTNTNEAYNPITRGGGGGGGGGRQQGIQPRSQQVRGSHEDADVVPAPPPLQSSQCQRGARAATGAASEGKGGGGTGEEEGIYELIPQ